jgi:hypothetical protein
MQTEGPAPFCLFATLQNHVAGPVPKDNAGRDLSPKMCLASQKFRGMTDPPFVARRDLSPKMSNVPEAM